MTQIIVRKIDMSTFNGSNKRHNKKGNNQYKRYSTPCIDLHVCIKYHHVFIDRFLVLLFHFHFVQYKLPHVKMLIVEM